MRFWVCDQCNQRQIGGWVRNEHDGSVTALLLASSDQLDEATVWLATGPASAKVTAVEVLQPSSSESKAKLSKLCTVIAT